MSSSKEKELYEFQRRQVICQLFRACAIKRAIVAANMLFCCCCAAILVYCSVRDWTRNCYVIGFENYIRIHPFTSYRIR